VVAEQLAWQVGFRSTSNGLAESDLVDVID